MTTTFSADWRGGDDHRSCGECCHPAQDIVKSRTAPGASIRSLSQKQTRTWNLIMALGMGAVHWRCLLPLLTAPRGGALQRLIQSRPEIWGSVIVPYLSRSWSVQSRFERIVDHCRTIERLGPDFDMASEAEVQILDLSALGPGYRMVLDQTRWLLRDGQLVLNLMQGSERLFSVAFCLSTATGSFIAYVGALQGRQEEGVLDTYREFTKLAHGMRPRDFTIDVFRLLCQAIGVTQIHAVSDKIRTAGVPRISSKAHFEKVKLCYDDAWGERGGLLRSDDFFDLPVVGNRRAEGEMGRKRAMYRRRYEMLDMLQAALLVRLAQPAGADRAWASDMVLAA